jgi:diguanylate cyclase (GGDEF)-like protein/PAS domain S-box-containing protein
MTEGSSPEGSAEPGAGRPLPRSDAHYRAITANSVDLLSEFNTEGEFTFVSDGFARVLGYLPESLLGRHARHLIHADDLALAGSAFRTAVQTQEPNIVAFRTMAADGSWHWLECTLTAFVAEDGEWRIVVVSRDVTANRAALDALSASQARLAAVVTNAPVVLFTIDRDGIFTLSEGKSLALLGLRPGEVVGRSAFELYSDHPDVVANLRRALAGEVFSTNTVLADISFETHYSPIRDEQEEITGIIGVAVDATGRVRAREALREAAEFRDHVLNTAASAIVAFDAEGRVTLANRRMYEITGYREEELLGQDLRLLRVPTTEIPRSEMVRMLAAGRPVVDVETEILRKDGARRLLRVNFAPLLRDGVPAGAVGTAEDITDLRRAQDALGIQSRLLEMVAAGSPLDETLHALARAVHEQSRDMTCAVFAVDGDATLLRCAAAAGLPQALFADVGAADAFGAYVAASGGQRGWSTPVRAGDRLLGSIELWADHAVEPDDLHLQLAQIAAHVAGLAIQRARAERAHRASELRYREIFERNTAVKLIVDPADARIVDANPAACAFYGYSREELTARTAFDLNLLPREQVLAELAAAAAEHRSYFQFKHRLASGEVRDIELYAGPMDGGDGRALICSIIHDITDRKWTESLVAGQRQLLEMIALGAPMDGVLDQIARTLELHAPGVTCAIYLVADDGATLRAAAAPTMPAEFTLAFDGAPATSISGPCGAVVESARPVTTTDIEGDPAWQRHGELALSHGLRACTAAPIFSTAGAVLGVLAMYYREARQPSDREHDVIAISAHMAGVAIEQHRAEEAARGRADELERLYERLIGVNADLEDSKLQLEEKSALLAHALNQERERSRRDQLTGAFNHAAIAEEMREAIAAAGKGCVAIAMLDVDGLKAANDTYGHPVGDAVLINVAQKLNRHGAIVGRYGGDEFMVVLPGADRDAAERYRDEVLQALAASDLTDPQSGAPIPVVASIGLAIYPEEAEAVGDLIRLSDSAMYASRRQRSTGDATLTRTLGGDRAAKMVGEIVPLLTSPGDLSNKMRLVAHRLSVGAGYDGVNFLLADAANAGLASSAFARAPEADIEVWNRRASRGIPRRLSEVLLRTRRPLIVDDLEVDVLLKETQRKMLQSIGLRSVLIAPMIWEDELIGLLSIGSKRTSGFSIRDAEFVMAVATQVTAIVRMDTLVGELRSSSARLRRAHTETVLMLAGAAEAHDHTTGRHLQRVRSLAESLAGELGYDEAAVQDLGLAAVLHDIGKIRVPDMVLGSSAGLAESEWVLMKHHTVWGSEFLSGQQGFELAAQVARSHHERWDGKGYPEGLRGDDIPEAAQITAVADAFDAMTNDRPYRLGRPTRAAVDEIVRCAGAQFSPRVVEALVRLHDRGELEFTPDDPLEAHEAA